MLIRPDLCSFRNVQSYVTTGTEAQHMEICEAILSYMLSIENLLIGCDCTGHANFLESFNIHSVQEYIDNSRMTRNTTGVYTDVEMLCFSHIFNFNVYVFDGGRAVFSPASIERRLLHIYNIKGIYLYPRHSHFYVVALIKRT